jgi:hypothetical protein
LEWLLDKLLPSLIESKIDRRKHEIAPVDTQGRPDMTPMSVTRPLSSVSVPWKL